MRKYPLKTLYTLLELSTLNQYLPGEEPSPKLLGKQRLLFYHGGAKRARLQQCIKAELEDKYQRIWGMGFLDPWVESHSEGALCFVLVWDHWQEGLKEICCRPVGTSQDRRSVVRLEDVWEDSDEESP